MKHRGFIAAILAAVLMTGVAVAVMAQPPAPQGGAVAGPRRGPGGPGGQFGPMGRGGFGLPGLRELDLTDAQKEQIKNIQDSHRTEVQQIAQRTRDAQRAIDEAANGTSVDESAIRSRSTALASAIADGAILRAKVNAEILSVLTAEQQQKLNELRAQRKERMRKGR